MAEAFVKGGIEGDQLAAVDHSALEAAAAESTPEDKVAKLRRSADAGGIQAATTWVLVCGMWPKYVGCADGLVDALLPNAEAQHAVPMVLLSFVHLEGIGVKRDPAAAWALLDAAERIAPQEAIIDFISLWNQVRGDAPLPPEVEQRLARTQGQAKAARLIAIQRKANAGKAKLDAAELAFLTDPAVNQRSQGFAVLVDYYAANGDKRKQQDLTIKAAEAGHTIGRARYGEALIDGGVEGIARDVSKGEKLLAAAAHDGNAWSAQYLASRSYSAADFSAVERWLMAPASASDVGAIMFLAGLYEEERPGVNGKADRALEIYQMLAAGECGRRTGAARAGGDGAGRSWHGEGSREGQAMAVRGRGKGRPRLRSDIGIPLSQGRFREGRRGAGPSLDGASTRRQ